MRKFGLIGYPLGHSFSAKYFTEKFAREGITDAFFELYELESLEHFPRLVENTPELQGLSVTIPYKEQIIPYLDELDLMAQEIGAVNCINFHHGKLIGHNTDYVGFKLSLQRWLGQDRPNALILGTGGASKAVAYALKDLGMDFQYVSRNSGNENPTLTYDKLNQNPAVLEAHPLIINTTPLGTYPHTEAMPDIPLDAITAKHKVYDLVYNPEKTFLMRSVEARGGLAINGLEMLQLQADAAWQIWNQS